MFLLHFSFKFYHPWSFYTFLVNSTILNPLPLISSILSTMILKHFSFKFYQPSSFCQFYTPWSFNTFILDASTLLLLILPAMILEHLSFQFYQSWSFNITNYVNSTNLDPSTLILSILPSMILQHSLFVLPTLILCSASSRENVALSFSTTSYIIIIYIYFWLNLILHQIFQYLHYRRNKWDKMTTLTIVVILYRIFSSIIMMRF